MSRVGKKPIKIPQGVEVKQEDGNLIVKGAEGEIVQELHPEIKAVVGNGKVVISLNREYSTAPQKIKALWGLYRNLINNAILGVSQGFEKKLEINGVGYRAQVEGEDLILNVGFSHPVKVKCPEGIKFSVEKNIVTVSGIDKEKVGRVAAKIRKIREADPYKAKGIKYIDEKIRRKEGKKAVGAEE